MLPIFWVSPDLSVFWVLDSDDFTVFWVLDFRTYPFFGYWIDLFNDIVFAWLLNI